MLSETRINELQKELLLVYQEVEDDLLKSIARDISIKEPEDIHEWQSEQLNRLSGLNRRNKSIIAEYSGRTEEEINALFRTMAIESVEDDEPLYKKAIEKDLVKNVAKAPAESKAIKRIIDKAIKDADKPFNLVNTKALESANKEFRQIINTTFIQVDSGIYDYKTAVRRGIIKLADKGITGQTYEREDGTLVNYQLDTAVRREVVTSSLQTARDAQDARAKEYGSDLIEVTSHVGARPKCALDQGKIYSNSGKSKKYKARSTTSEGDADGLFGVNCKHQYYPFFPGISEQRFDPIAQKKNDRIREEQEKQRYLERQVRKQKRRLIMLDEVGDTEGFQKESVRLKKKEADLKAFINKTGRTQQPRTQEVGFNRSLSQKAVNANKKAKESRNE